MNPGPDQSECVPVYDGSDAVRSALIRAIVAMANTRGGRVVVESVRAGAAELEPAAIRQRLDLHVAPRLRGVDPARGDGGCVVVNVRASDAGPHVFVGEGPVTGPGGERAWHAGQVWVREGGRSRPASGGDLQRMVREAASAFLERLSVGMRDPAALRLVDEGESIPVRLAADEEAVPVAPNLARLYPHTATTLARALGRPTNWAAAAVKALRLKDAREYGYGVPSPGGRVVQWRYSDRALERLREELARDPAWAPYGALRADAGSSTTRNGLGGPKGNRS